MNLPSMTSDGLLPTLLQKKKDTSGNEASAEKAFISPIIRSAAAAG
jgi:hypothetical protein